MTILDVAQGRQPLVAIAAFSLAGLAAAFLFVRTLSDRIRGGRVEIEGVRLDSLNLANLSRTMNASLLVEKVLHVGRISGRDLEMTYEYSGVCNAKQGESGCVFSIHADS